MCEIQSVVLPFQSHPHDQRSEAMEENDRGDCGEQEGGGREGEREGERGGGMMGGRDGELVVQTEGRGGW